MRVCVSGRRKGEEHLPLKISRTLSREIPPGVVEDKPLFLQVAPADGQADLLNEYSLHLPRAQPGRQQTLHLVAMGDLPRLTLVKFINIFL